MKAIIKTAWASLLALSFFISPSNAQEERNLEPFDALSATGGVRVILEEGTEEKAVLEVKGIPADEVTVKVQRGELKIKVLKTVFYKNEEVTVYVTYKKLRGVKASAGAQINGRSVIRGDQLEAKAFSGAKVELEVEVNSVDGAASEGGVLTLKGKTDTQDVSAGTGGQYFGFDLECNRTYARANTGGQLEVVARKALEASANTGGSIEYKGDPESVSTKEVLSGNIRKA